MFATIWRSIDCLDPDYLWLLIPTFVAFVGLQRWLSSRNDTVRLGRWRRRISITLRLTILVLLIGALADVATVQRNSRLAVMFCVDRSASLDPVRQQWMLDWVRQATQHLDSQDHSGMIVFGEQSAVETPLQPEPKIADPKSSINSDYSNIASALRLAQACFPGSARRAIVLLSDGQQNREDSREEALAAKAANIPVITVHSPPRQSPGEALVDSISAPDSIQKQRAFIVRVNLLSQTVQPAHLTLQVGSRLIADKKITLKKGQQSLEFPVSLDQADWHVFKVNLEAEADENPRNNVAYAVTEVVGKPKALLVDRNPDKIAPLAKLLEQNGFVVTTGAASQLPVTRTQLAAYDVVVISDVPALAWSPDQMTAIQNYVRHLGGGLVMLGGTESFGLGGYYKTPIEDVLPVECDIRNKDDLAEMTILYSLDTSGSMSQTTNGLQNIELAREAVRRTIELVYERDQLGIMGFHSDSYWALPIQKKSSGLAIERALGNLETGGGTGIHNAFKNSIETLSSQQTELKHLVLLTDGRSTDQGDYEAVLNLSRRSNISVTTVGVGDGIDAELLKYIARDSNGRFFHARDATELPRIFTKDALTGARSLLVEKSFTPHRLLPINWFTQNIDQELPALHGLVLSTLKPAAEQILSSTTGKEGKTDGPILARWRTGLGKSVAFTSEIGGNWGRDWQDWPELSQFWLRMMNWVRRDRYNNNAEVNVTIKGNKGHIQVRYKDSEINASGPEQVADLQARVVGPAGSVEIKPFSLDAIGPGQYTGEFKTSQTGVYLVTVSRKSRNNQQILGRSGAVFSYPEEFRVTQSNPQLLKQIAEITDGKFVDLKKAPPADLFELDIPVETSAQSIWQWLVLLAASLWVLDIATRRVNLRQLLANLQPKDEREHDLELIEALITKKDQVQSKLKASKSQPVKSASKPTQIAAARPAPPPKLKPVTKPTVDRATMTSALLAAKRRARKSKPGNADDH